MNNREGYEAGAVKSFIYSKHLAQQDLQHLDSRMRQEGIGDECENTLEPRPSSSQKLNKRRTSSTSG